MRRRLNTFTDNDRHARRVGICVCLLVVCCAGAAVADDDDGPAQKSHDGLELVPDSDVMGVWLRPGVDFSLYERVMIPEVPVAFRRGWQVQQNRSSVNRITSRDVQRIKDETSSMLRDAIVKELSGDGGFDVVDTADTDVLLIRPQVVDLDVTAPDTRGTRTTHNLASSAGSATLYLELFDSVSGEILGRAVDQRVARTPGDIMRMSNSVTNRSEAEKIFAGWADLLREGLDELRGARSESE